MSILQEILNEASDVAIKATLITDVNDDPEKIIKDSISQLMTKMSNGIMGDGEEDEVVFTTWIHAAPDNMIKIKEKLKGLGAKVTDVDPKTHK